MGQEHFVKNFIINLCKGRVISVEGGNIVFHELHSPQESTGVSLILAYSTKKLEKTQR